MKRAVNINDVLQVQKRLGDVRGQIEQLQGQLNYLSRQIDMSTISVSMTSEADIEVFGIRWQPLFIIKQALRNMLTGLTSYANSMISFLFFLPQLLLWLATIALILYIVWRIIKWLRRKFFPKNPAV